MIKVYQILFYYLGCLKKLLTLLQISSRTGNLTHMSVLKVIAMGKNCFFPAYYCSWNTGHFNTLVLVPIAFPCDKSYDLGIMKCYLFLSNIYTSILFVNCC